MADFTIRIDDRAKQLLLEILEQAKDQVAREIKAGDYTEKALVAHEELLQLHRGVLYVAPNAPVDVAPAVESEEDTFELSVDEPTN